ncbi:MAG: hypothetical protein CVU61_02735 [Deltaproteobacteria bacterium HGW-Deltaproteobacteria-19]|nr:MAG: hypothetical protein CVU61_02735 [Deltaproteobacteria bacterium HGW-Deltaproteobacteria-19]
MMQLDTDKTRCFFLFHPVLFPRRGRNKNQAFYNTTADARGTITRMTYDAYYNPWTTRTGSHPEVTYTYDLAGNLTELVYPGDRKVLYTYDDLYRLKTVRIDWLNQEASYAYDEAGRLISLTNFNGTVTTNGYDNAGRPTSIDNTKSDGSTISSYRFTLDGNGNRTGVEQNEPLLSLLETKDTAFTYNEKKNRLLTAGNNAFGYDKEGQLNSGYEKTYSFDLEHRLKSIGEGIEFTYDGKGTRIRATRDGVMTNYVYDAGGNLLAEADKDGNILHYYIHGKGLLAVVAETPTRMYCYHYNATGSTIAMTDEAQTVVNQYSYDPHGYILNQQEQIPQSFKYVGQYGVMAEPNGFYYMRARYYDPQAGRFVSEDPSGFEGGDINLYAYVANNPMNGVDPDGLCGQSTGGNRLNKLTDFAAGFGDGITLGATNWLREKMGINDVVNSKSGYYLSGAITGFAWGVAINARGYATGAEFSFGKNLRIAPWGNRTGSPTGELPHYHRRIIGSDGKTVPGGGIGKHRPWEGR